MIQFRESVLVPVINIWEMLGSRPENVGYGRMFVVLLKLMSYSCTVVPAQKYFKFQNEKKKEKKRKRKKERKKERKKGRKKERKKEKRKKKERYIA